MKCQGTFTKSCTCSVEKPVLQGEQRASLTHVSLQGDSSLPAGNVQQTCPLLPAMQPTSTQQQLSLSPFGQQLKVKPAASAMPENGPKASQVLRQFHQQTNLLSQSFSLQTSTTQE